MKHKVITFGEIMLRLATPGFQRISQTKGFEASFGGGEANVAVSLSNFGIPAEFVSCIPENDIGDACLRELNKYGVGTKFIYRGGDRLGIYFLEKGASYRASKVIYDRTGSAISQISKGMIDWDAVFDKSNWFHWTGITPAISQGAAEVCEEAIQKAKEKGITVSCDLNFRSKLWKYGKSALEVMPGLVKDCDIILGNEEDAALTLGINPEGVDVSKGKLDTEAYRSVSQQIMKKFPNVKKVITTLRTSISASHNKWSGVLYDGTTLLKAPVYDITHIVDRVGAGDSFMAGLIYGLLTFKNDQVALEFATLHPALSTPFLVTSTWFQLKK